MYADRDLIYLGSLIVCEQLNYGFKSTLESMSVILPNMAMIYRRQNAYKVTQHLGSPLPHMKTTFVTST